MTALTFAHLREINLARCIQGWNHPLDSWSVDDWLVALAGEVGEACNIVKKLNRERDRIMGNSKAPAELLADLADEIADAVIYLDLWEARRGLDFVTQWGDSSFIELRNYTSAYSPGITGSAVTRAAIQALGEVALEVRGSGPLLLRRLDELAHTYDIDLGAAVIGKFKKHGMPHRLEAA